MDPRLRGDMYRTLAGSDGGKRLSDTRTLHKTYRKLCGMSGADCDFTFPDNLVKKTYKTSLNLSVLFGTLL